MPELVQNQNRMPGAGEKFSPFGRVPGTVVQKHSPFTKSGHAPAKPTGGPQPMHSEWPRTTYHATIALNGWLCESEEKFEALQSEDSNWSLFPVAAPVAPPVAVHAESSPGGMDRIMQSFDAAYADVKQERDILKGEVQALTEENTNLKVKIAGLEVKQATSEEKPVVPASAPKPLFPAKPKE